MKKVECNECGGYGQVQIMKMGWNGPDVDVDMCYDCEGRGFIECPDPNELMKNILNERSATSSML